MGTLVAILSIFGLLAVPSLGAITPSQSQRCVYAVYSAYKDIAFSGPPNTKSKVAPYCENYLLVNSIYASALERCTLDQFTDGLQWYMSTCADSDFALLPLSKFSSTLTPKAISELRVVDYHEVSSKIKQNASLIISERFYNRVLKSMNLFEAWAEATYGFAIYGFWGGIILIGMMHNLAKSIWHLRASKRENDIEAKRLKKSESTLFTALYRPFYVHLVLPPIFGSKHHQPLLNIWNVPLRVEALVVASYWALSIILSIVGYPLYAGNVNFASQSQQLGSYMGKRTAFMILSNLAWLWMFSGRNNIFIWATGWSFQTFNLFHRHIARVVVIIGIVHSAIETWFRMKTGEYKSDSEEIFFQMGVAGFVAMCISAFIASSRWLRNKYYEAFLYSHIVLAVIFVIGMFYHVSIHDGAYEPYLYPVVAIWSFERFLRLVKLIYCNLQVNMGKNMIQTSTSIAIYDKDADIIKVSIRAANKLLHPRPGQYYHLYRPMGWKGWESHPFTLGSYTRTAIPHSTNESVNQVDIPFACSTESTAEYRFWIRPYNGWTRHLRDACLRDGGSKTQVFLEGPYGQPAHLYHYEQVLLIAGGSGISAIIPYLEEHVYRDTIRGLGSSRGHQLALATRHIDLIRTSKQCKLIETIATQQLGSILGREDVSAQFFCSKSSSKQSRASSDRSKPSMEPSAVESEKRNVVGSGKDSADIQEATVSSHIHLNIKSPRPDIKAIITETAREFAQGGRQAGHLAVLVCGPPEIADEARIAVYDAMKAGCHAIEFIEETFSV